MRVLALTALVACGGAKRPIPRVVAPARAATSPVPRAAAQSQAHFPAAPSLDLADVLPPRDPPWPLTELPSVQPHLDVAMAHDACSDEFAKRHPGDADLLGYVAAWCQIREDRSALDALGKLAREARGEIARAARLDVVNLLADEELAGQAISRLDAIGLSSVESLDMLAATYDALGRREEAEVIERHIVEIDLHPSAVASCERFLAWGKLDDRELGQKLAAAEDGAGDCARQARLGGCVLREARYLPVGVRKCLETQPTGADPAARLALAVDYASWRDDWAALLHIARDLEGRLRIHRAEELAVAALEAALLASDCDTAAVAGVRDAASALLRDDEHSARYDARLRRLAQVSSCKLPP